MTSPIDRMFESFVLEDEPGWYYISFVDTDPLSERKVGDKFIGGCYVQARGTVTAVTEAHRLGCNPGGEAAVAGPLDEETMDANVPPDERNRLLSRAEVEGR